MSDTPSSADAERSVLLDNADALCADLRTVGHGAVADLIEALRQQLAAVTEERDAIRGQPTGRDCAICGCAIRSNQATVIDTKFGGGKSRHLDCVLIRRAETAEADNAVLWETLQQCIPLAKFTRDNAPSHREPEFKRGADMFWTLMTLRETPHPGDKLRERVAKLEESITEILPFLRRIITESGTVRFTDSERQQVESIAEAMRDRT